MVFEHVQIVGMHFRGEHAKEYAAALQPGDKLLLEREPDNQFDQNAIKVLAPGDEPWHMGYVNRHTAAWLGPHMDDGTEFVAVVEELQTHKNNVYPYVHIGPKSSGPVILDEEGELTPEQFDTASK